MDIKHEILWKKLPISYTFKLLHKFSIRMYILLPYVFIEISLCTKLMHTDNVVTFLFQNALIDDDSAEKFRSEVTMHIKMLNIIQYSVIAIGGLLMLLCIISAIAYLVKNKQQVIVFFKEKSFCTGQSS